MPIVRLFVGKDNKNWFYCFVECFWGFDYDF